MTALLMSMISARRRCGIPHAVSGNTVSLLHFDGADGSSSFVDESGKSWSPSGLVQISTLQSKFGPSSGLFSGGRVDCIPGGNDFDFGTGDFTIEMFVRLSSAPGAVYLDNRFGSFGTGIAIANPSLVPAASFTIAGI